MTHSAAVLARVRAPGRVGVLAAGPDVGTGEAGSLEAGTMARIQVRVGDGRIAAAVFKVYGCSAAIASASLVTEWLDGATLEAARALDGATVAAALELAPERRAVAALVVAAARAAVADWESRQGRPGGGPAGTGR
ncbi:MAG: iron-sulfur cluster assembly scaffold protein [Vicinamibacterales bacterium]